MRLRVRYRNRLDPKRRALDVKATVDRERMRAPLWKRFDGCRWVRKGMNPPILQTVLVAHEHPHASTSSDSSTTRNFSASGTRINAQLGLK